MSQLVVGDLDDAAAVLGLLLPPTTGHHISIVGGGGKTTLSHALGAQLGGRTVVTCTTKMGHDQAGGRPLLLDPTIEQLVDAIDSSGGPVVAWQAIDGQRALGVDADVCDLWFRDERIDNVVIEADGSRRRPFKAPAPYEPVVPTSTTVMLSVIGLDAIGQPIAAACHRPEIAAALVDADPAATLTPERAAQILLADAGARKECPVGADYTVVLSKAGSHPTEAEAVADALRAIDPDVAVVALSKRDG